jgi:hypothetical protein
MTCVRMLQYRRLRGNVGLLVVGAENMQIAEATFDPMDENTINITAQNLSAPLPQIVSIGKEDLTCQLLNTYEHDVPLIVRSCL